MLQWHEQLYAAFSEYFSDKRLGKTRLVKLLYFAQETEGAALGYTWDLETFGPFDHTILDELEEAIANGVATMRKKALDNGSIHYDIHYHKLPLATIPPISASVLKYGHLSNRHLEALASLHFLFRSNKCTTIESVKGIKPRYAYSELNYLYDYGVQLNILPGIVIVPGDVFEPPDFGNDVYKKHKEEQMIEDYFDWDSEEDRRLRYLEAWAQAHKAKGV